MNIGSLYKVKKWSWLLFPTKETAELVTERATPIAIAYSDASADAAWHSKLYNCEVTYFSPDSIVVFLEDDGKYKKVLTSEGLIGWTWFIKNYNDCFEEVKHP